MSDTDDAFIKHLISLAPEGETFLFVRQTPRRASDGTIELQHVLHLQKFASGEI